MLYLAIPAHNEAATIGVLLWRLRTVLAEFPREYEAVVYDDASSDGTSEILESYARVMPLTVLRGERQVGYAGAVDALVRHVARDTRYPRRDAMLLLQGDFTDSPALVPEFVKRFEGGTDVVVGERGSAVRRKAPTPVKRLLKAEPWLLRFLVRAEGIRDLTGSYRLIRISVLRDLLRVVGEAPVCAGDSRTANADFLMRIVPLARRVETLPVEPTWDVRLRETRVVAVTDGMNLLRWAWRSRGQRAVPSTAPEPAPESPRQSRGGRAERGDRDGRPELRLEGRPERHADSSPAADSGRFGNRDSTRGANRSNRSARSEERTEKPRGTRDRGEPRVVKPLEREPASNRELVADTEPGGKPARRKRSRKSGRERALGRQELTDEASVVPAVVSNGVPAREREISNDAPAREREVPLNGDVSDAPDGDAEIPERLEAARDLSPALHDAVDDAEAALDSGGRLRPARKKRRRRGSRGGRLNGERDDQASGLEGSEPISSESGNLEETGGSSEDEADSPAGEGDAEQSNEAGARVRRRGRRGRRGGTRRSRNQQGEAPSEGGINVEGGAPSASPAPE